MFAKYKSWVPKIKLVVKQCVQNYEWKALIWNLLAMR